ncbi:hypothetical protein NLU13_5440 [Sarocladium strictum]|uniref:Protein SQS1 n=1 Tax=Sarocladium strictum TaxID=5046 RepID=A0AA39GGW4_SARSR|nr:hypothetical protein NLU13_5440 [Sarocladium strictum]
MEAARETSRHDHKAWDMSSLRTKPVVFVSAGNTEPLKQLENPSNHEDAYISEEHTREPNAASAECRTRTPTGPDETETPDIESATKASDPSLDGIDSPGSKSRLSLAPFFFDVSRNNAAASVTPDPTATPQSRAPSRQSDSSEEVILFKGRDSRATAQLDEHVSMTHCSTEVTVAESQTTREPQVHLETRTQAATSFLETHQRKKRVSRRHQRPPKKPTSDDDDMIADYIENMRQNGEEDMMLQMLLNQQDIGGSDYIPSEESDTDVQETDEALQSSKDVKNDLPNQTGDAANDQHQPESDLDDETLARLLAGHELGQNPDPFADANSDNSDSSDEPQQWIDDLDVMDWDRPSLQRRKGKGARGRIRVDVSDSELEQSLQAAWKNDRFKKAERKRQREEMRALGQLGRNAKPEDLRVKYPQGISIDEVADEMRTFLQGTSETLALPPMDKHARKVIHDLANKFNIKSKSVGNADNRRPTLYRTKRTQQYSAASFDQAVNRITRRYFPRLDGRRGKGAPRTIGSGRVNVAAATVQDGEIVGAAAPELGVENRGRAMLEKMGWSQGTALGALDNKGILQPVSHAMKRSKAGLG